MGMFDKILNKEGKEEEKQIQEQRDFVREQDMMSNATASEQVDQFNQESRSDLLKWQQDLSDEIEKLKHRLRSEHLNAEGQWVQKLIPVGYDDQNKVVYDLVPPLANEIFIDYIETQVEPFLSRNMFSSNFNEKRILQMLKNTCNDIADAMADGWDIYAIEFINFNMVMRLIKNIITPGPFRALNDGQRRHDRTIAKRVEAFQDRETNSPRKSFMGINME